MAWLLLTPLFVSLFTAVLLYIPPIQRWAIDQATSYASEKLGMDIRMSRVSISFPLDLELHGLEIEQDGESVAGLGSLGLLCGFLVLQTLFVGD